MSLNQFAEIAELEDSVLQHLLRATEIDDYLIALRDVDTDSKRALYRNMPERVLNFIEEDIAARTGVQAQEVMEAQARILEVASSLSENS